MLVNIENVKTVTLEEVANITGWNTKDFVKINKSGVYRLLSGSRGYFEEIEFVQDLSNNELKLMDKEECLNTWTYDEYTTKEEMKEYVDEFYGFEVEEKCVTFGYTEEEFDYYFKVVV